MYRLRLDAITMLTNDFFGRVALTPFNQMSNPYFDGSCLPRNILSAGRRLKDSHPPAYK